MGTLARNALALWTPTQQNAQTHSNNSSAKAGELFDCVDHFVGSVLKGLTLCWEEITLVLDSFRSYNFTLNNQEFTLTKEMVKDVKRYKKDIHGTTLVW